MNTFFKNVKVMDTCFSQQDGGWSFLLKLDQVFVNAWYDPAIKTMKLWYKNIELALRGESTRLLASDLETAICFSKLPDYKTMNFKHE